MTLPVKRPDLLREAALGRDNWLLDGGIPIEILAEEAGLPAGLFSIVKNKPGHVAAANATETGLVSFYDSSDNARMWSVREALDYGMVGVNTGHVSSTKKPIGGVKSSALGRAGARHGLDDFLESKYICMGGINPAEEV